MKRYSFVYLLFLTFHLLHAQPNNIHWADSVLQSFDSDVNREYVSIKLHADSLLTIFSRTKEDCKWIETQAFRSLYLSASGKYKLALDILNQAQSKYDKGSCKKGDLSSHLNLCYGSLYTRLGEDSKALAYIQRGIDHWQNEFKSRKNLIRLYNAKANTFESSDSQLFYYKKALEISLVDNEIELEQILLVNIGLTYANENQYKQAESYLKKALVIASNRNDYLGLYSIYNGLAGISDDDQTILNYIDSAKYYATVRGNIEELYVLYDNLAYFYTTLGKYHEAYDTLNKASWLKDSLFNKNKIQAFAEMEQKYESEKKNDKIELLNREKEIANLNASRNLSVIYGLGIGLLSFVIVAFAFYRQSQKRKKLNAELSEEKKKSDDLLLNILPAEIAEELKQNGFCKARQFDDVTVLFTDFSGFTNISERLSPEALVHEVNVCFTAFDEIITRYGLEKIKTIGDAYMLVGGMPINDPKHAEKVIKAGKEFIDFIEKRRKEGGEFSVRIGVNSGHVVAGIVGVKKFAYDIWGDTVNTAARMEQNGEVGKINISGSTYELVKDSFPCSYRGKISAKNKGDIDMYFVN